MLAWNFTQMGFEKTYHIKDLVRTITNLLLYNKSLVAKGRREHFRLQYSGNQRGWVDLSFRHSLGAILNIKTVVLI